MTTKEQHYAVPPPPLIEQGGPIALLKMARWYLREPDGWTKLAWARMRQRSELDPTIGIATTATSGSATCWCSSGAVTRAHSDYINAGRYTLVGGDSYTYALDALTIAARWRHPMRPTMSVPEWNDYRAQSHEEVLEVFDSAIGILEDALAQHGNYLNLRVILTEMEVSARG